MDFKVGQRVRVVNADRVSPDGKDFGACPVSVGCIGIVTRELNCLNGTIWVDYDGRYHQNTPQYPWRFAPITPDDPEIETDF